MTLFEVHRDSRLTAPQAWARLTDWQRHGDFIPFTDVVVTHPAPEIPGTPEPGAGATFVARTSIGPLHFDDPMEVTYWHPPNGGDGLCRLVKTGRVVTGWAVLRVVPTPSGCSITWKEDAAVRFAGTLLSWPTKVLAGKVFGRLVDQLLQERPDVA